MYLLRVKNSIKFYKSRYCRAKCHHTEQQTWQNVSNEEGVCSCETIIYTNFNVKKKKNGKKTGRSEITIANMKLKESEKKKMGRKKRNIKWSKTFHRINFAVSSEPWGDALYIRAGWRIQNMVTMPRACVFWLLSYYSHLELRATLDLLQVLKKKK